MSQQWRKPREEPPRRRRQCYADAWGVLGTESDGPANGRLALPQLAPPEFARRGLRKRFDELDLARIFVRGNGLLGVTLEFGDKRFVGNDPRRGDDEGLHLLSALGTRHPDHRAFRDGGVREERMFHFRSADVG